jgi:hypothetical protein
MAVLDMLEHLEFLAADWVADVPELPVSDGLAHRMCEPGIV